MKSETVKRPTMDDVYRWVGDVSKSAAQSWFTQQCADPYADLYLYFKQGNLQVSNHCPEGYELADGARLGPSGTIEQMTARIDKKARMLPILPADLIG